MTIHWDFMMKQDTDLERFLARVRLSNVLTLEEFNEGYQIFVHLRDCWISQQASYRLYDELIATRGCYEQWFMQTFEGGRLPATYPRELPRRRTLREISDGYLIVAHRRPMTNPFVPPSNSFGSGPWSHLRLLDLEASICHQLAYGNEDYVAALLKMQAWQTNVLTRLLAFPAAVLTALPDLA